MLIGIDLAEISSVYHYENAPYSIFVGCKNENFQLKDFDIFPYFCSKHRLCGEAVLTSWYPQSVFWSKNKKNRYTPADLSFVI